MPRIIFTSRLPALMLLMLALTVLLAGTTQAQQFPSTPEATPAAASSPVSDMGPRFVIYPRDAADGDFFTLEAEAGTTHELVVVLGNADDEPLDLHTYASNVIPIPNGGFAIDEAGAEAEGTTTWLEYPTETFTFHPGEGVERTFTVTVPEDAKPGQYITGIALATAEPLEVEGTALFEQVIRKTIAVFIIVPGPEEPAFTLGLPEVDYEGRFGRIIVPVENTGNVLVKPEGEVTVRNTEDEVVLTAPVTMGSVYAGFTVPLSVSLTTPLPEGDYTVSAELTDESTGVTATIDEAAITIVSAEELAAQVTIEGRVSLAPDPEDPAYADVALTISNPGEAIPNADVEVDVMRNGQLVETFPLASGIALPSGATPVMQRYVPPTGWEAGTWSFVIRVNAVDPSTDASTTVATLDSLTPVQVGG